MNGNHESIRFNPDIHGRLFLPEPWSTAEEYESSSEKREPASEDHDSPSAEQYRQAYDSLEIARDLANCGDDLNVKGVIGFFDSGFLTISKTTLTSTSLDGRSTREGIVITFPNVDSNDGVASGHSTITFLEDNTLLAEDEHKLEGFANLLSRGLLAEGEPQYQESKIAEALVRAFPIETYSFLDMNIEPPDIRDLNHNLMSEFELLMGDARVNKYEEESSRYEVSSVNGGCLVVRNVLLFIVDPAGGEELAEAYTAKIIDSFPETEVHLSYFSFDEEDEEMVEYLAAVVDFRHRPIQVGVDEQWVNTEKDSRQILEVLRMLQDIEKESGDPTESDFADTEQFHADCALDIEAIFRCHDNIIEERAISVDLQSDEGLPVSTLHISERTGKEGPPMYEILLIREEQIIKSVRGISSYQPESISDELDSIFDASGNLVASNIQTPEAATSSTDSDPSSIIFDCLSGGCQDETEIVDQARLLLQNNQNTIEFSLIDLSVKIRGYTVDLIVRQPRFPEAFEDQDTRIKKPWFTMSYNGPSSNGEFVTIVQGEVDEYRHEMRTVSFVDYDNPGFYDVTDIYAGRLRSDSWSHIPLSKHTDTAKLLLTELSQQMTQDAVLRIVKGVLENPEQ